MFEQHCLNSSGSTKAAGFWLPLPSHSHQGYLGSQQPGLNIFLDESGSRSLLEGHVLSEYFGGFRQFVWL